MIITKQYAKFIRELKQNIIQSKYQAARLANRENLLLYFKTGKMLTEKIAAEKWGAKVLEKISSDLQKELPGLKRFSTGNLKKMRLFYEGYKDIIAISSTLSNQIHSQNILLAEYGSWSDIEQWFFGLSFSHHFLLLTKIKGAQERMFYMQSSANGFWSLSVLEHHIESDLYHHQGKLPNNFTKTLPEQLKPSALQIFRDEYLMDFMSIEDPDDERNIENKVVAEIRNFILRIGKGFSFIGNQYRIELDGEEFFIDLLFFNRHLQSLVAFELKRGKFKPEYVGQLNFYLNVLDDKVKLPHENSSIGIVLCKEKNNTVVEYSVKSVDKAMRVATFKTTKKIPDEMKELLPNPNELTKLL